MVLMLSTDCDADCDGNDASDDAGAALATLFVVMSMFEVPTKRRSSSAN